MRVTKAIQPVGPSRPYVVEGLDRKGWKVQDALVTDRGSDIPIWGHVVSVDSEPHEVIGVRLLLDDEPPTSWRAPAGERFIELIVRPVPESAPGQ